jgi:hypothetical protein
MTEGARTVLELCQVARGELAESRMGSHWRLRWVAAITLLRTVAHVLSHIDRNSGPELRQAIDEVWAGIKVDPTTFSMT